jgi:hypothetical protein
MISLRTLLLAMALTGLFAGWAGYYTKGQFDKAAVVTQQGKAIKTTANNIADSAQKSGQIEADIGKSDAQIDAIQKAVAARLQKGKHHEPGIAAGGHAGPEHVQDGVAAPAQGTAPLDPAAGDRCDRDTLDFGTVRLLNSARDPLPVDPAPVGAR